MPRHQKATERRQTLHLGAVNIPVRIITEYGRRSCRAAVTQKALYIRLPHGLPPAEEKKEIDKMLDWARNIARKKPDAFAHLIPLVVADVYGFSFRGEDYRIKVVRHELKFHRIVETGSRELEVQLSSEDTRLQVTKVIPKLLAKFFGQKYLLVIEERVRILNEQHFRRPVRKVSLNDTYTRWGSCSHVGNINLATRLILAPDIIIDAVIIHELAHLVEQNHSSRFWAEVARALPEYREHDVWLNEHGGNLRFDPIPLV